MDHGPSTAEEEVGLSLHQPHTAIMPDTYTSERRRDPRRSTRVPIRVRIEVHATGSIFEGETVVVNLHGALIRTAESLTVGSDLTLLVTLTGKSAAAQVVFVDPEDLCNVGIELVTPENIWGVSLLPDDWESTAG